MVHSTSLNKIKNIDNLLERAGRNLIGIIDPAYTIRQIEITNAIHDEIYDYSCPSDLKGLKLIDIRPQLNRNIDDKLRSRYSQGFDLHKRENTFHIETRDSEKILRLSKGISPSPTKIHEFDSLTANGTITAGDDACNLTIDKLKHVSGGGSLRFNLDGSGTIASIILTDFADVDLENQDERGELFLRHYMPDKDRISNVELRWGNDSSNYWSASTTSPHDQDEFKRGWNILRFTWDGATETGTVDPTAIDYAVVVITYDGTADTDFRLDKLSSSIGEIWDVIYYSKYLFQTSDGTWQESVTDDTNVINLDTDGYNLFLFEALKAISQQQQGKDARADYVYATGELATLYPIYETNHPTEALSQQESYYSMSNLKRGVNGRRV